MLAAMSTDTISDHQQACRETSASGKRTPRSQWNDGAMARTPVVSEAILEARFPPVHAIAARVQLRRTPAIPANSTLLARARKSANALRRPPTFFNRAETEQ